jgi:hypothetical protein
MPETVTTKPDDASARLAASGEHIAQFFTFAHLPPHLQEVSRPFAELAAKVVELPRNPERTVALRKLLEAKDAAVRALVAKH